MSALDVQTAADAIELTPEQKHAQWLAIRKTGIGGSDAAAACGLSPYKTPYQLWLEKTNQVEPEDISDKAPVRWGLKLEDVVADEYVEQTGKRVQRVNRTLRHHLHPFMLGNVDRRIVGENAGLECKTAGFWAGQDEAWGPSGSDQVPAHYLMQVMHYMAVTGWERFDLAVLIAGQDFRIYTVRRDEELIRTLTTLEADFWRRVQHNVAPDATQLEDVRRRFPTSVSRSVEVTPEILAHFEAFVAAKAAGKELESELDAHKAAIAYYMGDADTLVSVAGEPLLTWKTKSLGQRIDQKRLIAEHPDVFATLVREGLVKEGSTREMRVKGGS